MQNRIEENNTQYTEPSVERTTYAFKWSYTDSRAKKRDSERRTAKKRAVTFITVVASSFALLYALAVALYYLA